MTAKYSILVMVARYQNGMQGGGVSVATEVLEYDDQRLAGAALGALVRSIDRPSPSTGRFILDAIPLWET